ncbi:MAG: hypothetical protein JWQ14_28 [Adhaeribacter sp.]|nr:hypothetical protein [Adhaeribacter sp.]
MKFSSGGLAKAVLGLLYSFIIGVTQHHFITYLQR